MTSSLHDPYESGHTCATMVMTMRSNDVSLSKSTKHYLSSDCFLKLGNMKSESLVIANQHVAVNMFSGLVHTARHALGVGFILNFTKSLFSLIFYYLCIIILKAFK